ncbi:hypothetical protein GCM10028813_19510 [Ramlibacter alkalitolerans]
MSFLGRDATLTGRVSIWAQAIEAISRHPMLGYGIGAFWRSAGLVVNSGETYVIPHGHNGYLDLALDAGLAGATSFVVLLLAYFRLAYQKFPSRSEGYKHANTCAAVLLFFLLSNFAESSLVQANFYFFAVLFLRIEKRGALPARQGVA